jgi:hypothetical protein
MIRLFRHIRFQFVLRKWRKYIREANEIDYDQLGI